MMNTKGLSCFKSGLTGLQGKLVCLLLLAVLMAGCALVPAAQPTATQPPAATNTPQPTATDKPTNTPEPTATNTPVPPTDTPVPTPTANKAATEAAKATEAAAAAQAVISADLAKFDVTLSDGQLIYLQSDPVKIKLDSYNQLTSSEIKDSQAADFIMYTEITWESKSGLAGCGIIFRSEDNLQEGDQYQLFMMRLSGAPLWDIEWWTDGLFTYGWGLQSSSYIDVDPGATNQYLLVATGKQVSVYANGKRLGGINDNRRGDGIFAFYGYHESGETTCTFDNTWIWETAANK